MAKAKTPVNKTKSSTQETGSMRSVRRCFQMMECFDQLHRPMSATELANELNAPLSSMIDLLKCVCDLGYIAYDSRSRTYHPTTRIGLLGAWLNTNPLDQSSYAQIMDDLLDQTKETIGVFWQNDIEMKCVSALQGTYPISFNLRAGESLPLFGSAVGSALLAKWSNSEIKKAYERFKKQSAKNALALSSYMEAIEKTREDGYASGYGLVIPEVGAVTAALPTSNNRWMVFSLGGLSSRIKENEKSLSQTLIQGLGG